jgi:hypothetical protein
MVLLSDRINSNRNLSWWCVSRMQGLYLQGKKKPGKCKVLYVLYIDLLKQDIVVFLNKHLSYGFLHCKFVTAIDTICVDDEVFFAL